MHPRDVHGSQPGRDMAEAEAALGSHPAVSEALMALANFNVEERVYCVFVTLKDGIVESRTLRKELAAYLLVTAGFRLLPDCIHFTPAVPNTKPSRIRRKTLNEYATSLRVSTVGKA